MVVCPWEHSTCNPTLLFSERQSVTAKQKHLLQITISAVGLTAAWDLESGNHKAEVGLPQSEAPRRPRGRVRCSGKACTAPRGPLEGPLGSHLGPVMPHPLHQHCSAQPSRTAPSRRNISSHCPEADCVHPSRTENPALPGTEGLPGRWARTLSAKTRTVPGKAGEVVRQPGGPSPFLPKTHSEPESGC